MLDLSATLDLSVEAKVTNTGGRSGATIVLLFVDFEGVPTSSRTDQHRVPLRKALKNFRKLPMLQPGEAKVVEFLSSADELFGQYSESAMHRTVITGDYRIGVGGSLQMTKAAIDKREIVLASVQVVDSKETSVAGDDPVRLDRLQLVDWCMSHQESTGAVRCLHFPNVLTNINGSLLLAASVSADQNNATATTAIYSCAGPPAGWWAGWPIGCSSGKQFPPQTSSEPSSIEWRLNGTGPSFAILATLPTGARLALQEQIPNTNYGLFTFRGSMERRALQGKALLLRNDGGSIRREAPDLARQTVVFSQLPADACTNRQQPGGVSWDLAPSIPCPFSPFATTFPDFLPRLSPQTFSPEFVQNFTQL